MRALFTLIGYVSTATLIAIAVGLAYLWQTNLLTNQKMFRIVALVHDIDLDKIAEEENLGEQVAPPEEVSMEDVELFREVKLRDYEVKINALTVGKQEFERTFRDLNEGRKRFDQIASELKDRLEQQKELASEENLAAVVNGLEMMRPAEAKELLLRFMDEPDGKRDAIILMKEMQQSKLAKILLQFKLEGELDQYHEIQQLMLDGFPEGPEIENMLEQIQRTDAGP
ncbi:hypothetical protein [Aeoliella mucimassa]|uniref:Uncharacterized protein n=1 Tax=Aeoliella mucimassa TaxID=2527972 RepID=A0A518AKU5_9BACT|nr:hypothetical protein [Aeoliella mucimassa]QDU55316.1 hypothetical protein Pan181_15050 [Aeoliella mucimassa]